jgi:hypothetical protein
MTECWICLSHRRSDGTATETVLHVDRTCRVLQSAYTVCSVGDVDTDQYPVCESCGRHGKSDGGGDYSYYNAAATAEVADE